MPFKAARRTGQATAENLRRMSGVLILVRRDGIPLALFESECGCSELKPTIPTGAWSAS